VNRLRLGLALAGFIAAVLSVALEDHRLAWVAIALLAFALMFRLLLRKRENRPPPDGPPM
jgi:ABC-type branched-subunit amino acid transport system permease subunit